MNIQKLCLLSILLVNSTIYCMRNYDSPNKSVSTIYLINTTPQEFRNVTVVCDVREFDEPKIHATALVTIPRGGRVPVDADDLTFWKSGKKIKVAEVTNAKNIDLELKQLHIGGQIITIDSPHTETFHIYEQKSGTVFVN